MHVLALPVSLLLGDGSGVISDARLRVWAPGLASWPCYTSHIEVCQKDWGTGAMNYYWCCWQALKEKELGNAAYKKRDFLTALQHYDKATDLDPTDITFRTNKAGRSVMHILAATIHSWVWQSDGGDAVKYTRSVLFNKPHLLTHSHCFTVAAVYFEQGEYEQSIKECEKGVEIGREHRADYKLIAKWVHPSSLVWDDRNKILSCMQWCSQRIDLIDRLIAICWQGACSLVEHCTTQVLCTHGL